MKQIFFLVIQSLKRLLVLFVLLIFITFSFFFITLGLRVTLYWFKVDKSS